LPVLFIMISNHYPMTYSHEYSWLVLLAIIAITAFARHYFNLQHKGIKRPVILVVAAIAAATLAFVISPKPVAVSGDGFKPSQLSEVQSIITERCASCHSAAPTDEVFTAAPLGVMLDSLAEMKQWAPRIKARSVDTPDMPFMNKTGMTDEERQLVGSWIAAGAPAE